MSAYVRMALMMMALPLSVSVEAQTTPVAAKQKPAAILPAVSRPEALLFEKDLTALCNRVSVKLGMAPTKLTAAGSSNLPVSRMRVVAALVKMLVAPDSLEAYKTETPE